MVKNINNIIQVLSPGDAQLKALVDEAIQHDIVSNATIFLGIGKEFTVNAPNAWGDDFDNVPSDRYIQKVIITGNDVAFRSGNNEYPSSLTITRTVTSNNVQSPSLTIAEAYFGSTYADRESGKDFSAAIYPILLKHLSRDLPPLDPATDVKAFGIALTQMSEVSSNLIASLADARKEQEAHLTKALLKIEDRKAEVEAQLEDQRKEVELENEKRKVALDERENNLENARARDARRKLRNNITADVKEKLNGKLGDKETSQLNKLVIALAVIVTILCLGLAWHSFNQFSSIERTTDGLIIERDYWYNIAILIRGTLSFITGIAFSYWLLNHLRSRAEQTLARRNKLERFSLDIDRASWIIETVMEFKEDEEGVTNVPKSWLDGATSGLFSESNLINETSETDALSSLSDLLASGASLSLGNGGAQLKLDPKAAKKIAKSRN